MPCWLQSKMRISPELEWWGIHCPSLQGRRIMRIPTHLWVSVHLFVAKHLVSVSGHLPVEAFTEHSSNIWSPPGSWGHKEMSEKDFLYNESKHLVVTLESSINPVHVLIPFQGLNSPLGLMVFCDLLGAGLLCTYHITPNEQPSPLRKSKTSLPRELEWPVQVSLKGQDIFPQTGSRKQAAARLRRLLACLSNESH